MNGPGYWMHETSGKLRPVILAYFSDRDMTAEEVAAMRAYLRQWIMAPVWLGEGIDQLRSSLDGLTSKGAIRIWLEVAAEAGIDPL